MGLSVTGIGCLHDDIPMKEIGKIIKQVTLKKFIAAYEKVKR